jgi:hypothetical protein
MEQLCELSRSTLLINLHKPPGPQLAELIQQIFSIEAVAIQDANFGHCDRSGKWSEHEFELAKHCFVMQTDSHDFHEPYLLASAACSRQLECRWVRTSPVTRIAGCEVE